MAYMTLKDILAGKRYEDKYRNIHFLVDGRLAASLVNYGSFRCVVNVEVVYDERWVNIVHIHQGSFVVVYTDPVEVSSIEEWCNNFCITQTLYVHGAINGLAFQGDLIPLTWQQPKMATCMSSDSEMSGELGEQSMLARELLLHLTGDEWEQSLERQILGEAVQISLMSP